MSQSQGLNVTENGSGQSLPLGCMCVEGRRELYQAGVLNSGRIISQIAQLTLHALAEPFLYNSSATSCGLAHTFLISHGEQHSPGCFVEGTY